MIAEVVISDYWTERIELLVMFGSGIALGWLMRILWEREK